MNQARCENRRVVSPPRNRKKEKRGEVVDSTAKIGEVDQIQNPEEQKVKRKTRRIRMRVSGLVTCSLRFLFLHVPPTAAPPSGLTAVVIRMDDASRCGSWEVPRSGLVSAMAMAIGPRADRLEGFPSRIPATGTGGTGLCGRRGWILASHVRCGGSEDVSFC